MSHKLNKTMKTIITLSIALFLGQHISFAQEEMNEMEQQHKTEIFLEQNLMDFNAKFHTAFIASYKNFESILGEEQKMKDYIQYKTSIDFNKGINEKIHLNQGENKTSFFYSNFECDQDELIAKAMYNDIIKRILTVSPKGFEQTSERVNGNEFTTIKFNPKEADKSAHQPTTEVILNYEELVVQITINAPTKK